MGGTSKTETTNSSSQTQPWGPAQPFLTGVLAQLGGQLGRTGLSGAEDAALQAMTARGAAGNPYAPRIAGVADTLLAGGGPDRTAMVNAAYQDYRNALTPFARGDYVNPASNPALQPYLSTIANDVSNRVNSMFAGAGRDLSGANVQTLARGIAEGQAPVLLDAYNHALDRQAQAIDKLYGAGGTTTGQLSSLDQAALANRQAGVGAAGAALEAQNWGEQQMLAAEAQRQSVPLQRLAQLAGIGVPIAGLGKSETGTATKETSTPFNPLALAPLAFAPFTGGMSGLGAMGSLGSLFGSTALSGGMRLPTGFGASTLY